MISDRLKMGATSGLPHAGPRIALVQRGSAPIWADGICKAGYDFRQFADPDLLLQSNQIVKSRLVILSEFGGGVWAALEAVRKIRTVSAAVTIVVIATDSSESSAIAALKLGVNDYLRHPVTEGQVLDVVMRLITPKVASAVDLDGKRIIGESGSIRSLVSYASKLAATNSSVLITGETGTGKELAAELVHVLSARCDHPLVAINCAAIPDSLLESELFGRERGAYTGADSSYEGKLKLADSGTVLFDEIGDLTPYGQAKLLRVIETRRVQRLGSAKDIPLNIRILASTNQDLPAMVERGQFRRDLYFRICVTRLELPPLRARREDVPVLLCYFAEKFGTALGLHFPGFSSRVLETLTKYDWPGNVRQLRNFVEELFVRLPGRPIDIDDLPSDITLSCPPEATEPLDERTKIISALTSTHWNKKRAAKRLSWSRMTLYRKMAQHKIVGDATSTAPPPSSPDAA
jgi:DNA-binding NtrC family response regulator